MPFSPASKVLEIGCAEGGNLRPFLDIGCRVDGLDLAEARVDLARSFLADHPHVKNLRLFVRDIYLAEDVLENNYDLIFMKDVIEHIPDQEKLLSFLKRFLKPGGLIFFAFPPWHNPFGGHQQVCNSKILCNAPYLHLLPGFLYRSLLKWFGEPESRMQGLMELRKTGMSTRRMERILERNGYRIQKITHYLTNPNYEVKYNLRPRKQLAWIAAIPFFRDFVTTCSYYLAAKKG